MTMDCLRNQGDAMADGGEEIENLVETLALERIEENLYRGRPSPRDTKRIFGGHVIAQALLAAYATVEPERICHSLHCYFIRPGDPSVPILYEVDRARDGTSFTTRRVKAIQHGRQIFNFAASFQVVEEGFEHQADAAGRATAGIAARRHRAPGGRSLANRPPRGGQPPCCSRAASNNGWPIRANRRRR